jgi:small GTP-binding protein
MENYEAKHMYRDDIPIKLLLWETGRTSNQILRASSYPNTQVFLICFSVVDRKSLQNVEEIWLPEALRYVPNAKLVLCGTKIDLRGADDVQQMEGEERAEKLGFHAYVEHSAITNQGLKEAFEKCMELCVDGEKTQSKCCAQ